MPGTFILNCSIFHSFDECADLIKKLQASANHLQKGFYLALPFSYLTKFAQDKPPSFLYGVANMEKAQEESFTESVAGQLIKKAGGEFILLGTHKARSLFNETNEEIQRKIRKAIASQLTPFLCIGEDYQQLKEEKSAEVLTRQIGECVSQLTEEEINKLEFVYEAPWLVQAPFIPTFEEIQHAYQFARELVQSLVGSKVSKQINLFCPIPKDFLNPEKMLDTLDAPGFYLTSPSQLSLVLR